MTWVETPAIKWLLPIPMLAATAPLVWLVFRRTWRELDDEALAYRQALAARGEMDYRPLLALTLAALILTLHEYYGRWAFYDAVLKPMLLRREQAHPDGWWRPSVYGELYGRYWWGLTRTAGYLLPFAVWRLFFRHDSLLDFGLRTRGFREHAWVYALCVAAMVPLLLLVSRQPDFGSYYPIYKTAGRSWLDFLAWEGIYLVQFFTLEMFFRGWWIRATRAFGVGAIWTMALPYCMVHFGKPYLEVSGAIIAGVVLGSLSMRTRSIYAGFLVHATVAVLMDVLALDRRGALPSRLVPGGSRRLVFLHWNALIWIAWVLALAVLGLKLWRHYRRRRINPTNRTA